MARTRTLAEMRDEANTRADMVGSSLYTDAKVNRMINQSIARLYGKLVQARGDEYYRTSSTVQTVANTATVALPGDFFRLLGVDVEVGNRTYPADRVDWLRRNSYQDRNSSGWAGCRVKYSIEGANLRFFPTPDAVYDVTLWYIPHATELAADGETFDGINGWEEWVVLDVAIKMGIPEETDVRDLVTERSVIEQDILALTQHRDDGEPEVMQDIQGRHRGVDMWEWF